MSGDSHAPRLLAPGVGVLLGYILLVGNPWWNRDIQVAMTGSDSTLRLFNVMVAYPSWLLDTDEFGVTQFWLINLRTLLFVALAIAGLSQLSRWLRENISGPGIFAATVGVTVLSAAIAGLAATAIVSTLMDTRRLFPSRSGQPDDVFYLDQLSRSALFGVLFGLVVGAVVLAQRRSPAVTARRREQTAKRRTNAPRSFW